MGSVKGESLWQISMSLSILQKNWLIWAGKKAGEAVEVSKLKINNVKINGEIQKTYEKLGAFVYKFRKSRGRKQRINRYVCERNR